MQRIQKMRVIPRNNDLLEDYSLPTFFSSDVPPPSEESLPTRDFCNCNNKNNPPPRRSLISYLIQSNMKYYTTPGTVEKLSFENDRESLNSGIHSRIYGVLQAFDERTFVVLNEGYRFHGRGKRIQVPFEVTK